MYTYRHKLVIKGKLETGKSETEIALIDKAEGDNSNQKSAEALGQPSDNETVIQQLRDLHSAVVRTKMQSIKSLIS